MSKRYSFYHKDWPFHIITKRYEKWQKVEEIRKDKEGKKMEGELPRGYLTLIQVDGGRC